MALHSDVVPRFVPFTVLFADSDEDTRLAYYAIAVSEGLRVELASAGHEALALAGLMLPDVLVIESGLPEVDGFEVARRLRAGGPTHALPIVMVSRDRSERGVAMAEAAGCDAHLAKPCRLDELLGLLRLLVDRHRQLAVRKTSGDGASSSSSALRVKA